jgi:RNA polymerase sigma factor (sigma-70 family)
MSADGLRSVFRRLRRLTDPGGSGLGDAELLRRYAGARDEAAFELLLWRHGPMVLGVCRRLLRRSQDAEDAFQATFLTLVRKAGSVRNGEAVGAWLYRVAYRIALRARTAVAPCGPLEAEPEAAPQGDDVSWREVGPVLDEEVRRLPARYRDAVVLCYLEGRGQAEAARELGCARATVAVRLLRARKLLQKRLSRRGVSVAGAILLAAAPAPAAPAALVTRTLRMAAGGAVASRVSSLTDGVLRSMALTRLKATAAVLLLSAGLLAGGTALFSRAGPPAEAPPAEPARPESPAANPPERTPRLVRIPALRDGLVTFVGTEVAPGEKVPEDRRFSGTVAYLIVPVPDGEVVRADQVVAGPGGARWRRLREDEVPEPGRVAVHRAKKEYRRLEPGDRVKAGQAVALIEPTLAVTDLLVKAAGLEAGESERRASVKTKEEAERRVTAMEESMRRVPGSVSKDDYEGAKLTARRYFEEEIAKKAGVAKAQQELIRAMTSVDMHELHTPVSGVVKTVDRERGDVVKVLETVLTVEVPPGERRPAAPGRARAVRSVRDGILAVVGTEIKKGEKVPPELVVTYGTGAEAVRYRRLRVGDAVEPGQILARLDDRLARADVAAAESQVRAGEAELRAATRTREEADRRLKSMEESLKRVPGSVSPDDLAGARLTARLRLEEEVTRRANVAVREAELEHARAVLASYEVRSFSRGTVRDLPKVPGEAVRAGEPVLEVIEPRR